MPVADSFSFGRRATWEEEVSILLRRTHGYSNRSHCPVGVETHICSRTSQIYNLGASIAILFQARALEAVEGIRDTLTAAHDTLVLVVTEAALVADAHERRRSYVGIAHGAFAIAFVAETADGDTGLLAAHDEIAKGVVSSYLGGGRREAMGTYG